MDLLKDGTIVWNGQTYKSPSGFSLYFKRRITPSIKSDNGFNSILYRGNPLSVYVKRHKPESELNESTVLEPVASEDGYGVSVLYIEKIHNGGDYRMRRMVIETGKLLRMVTT
jgi:hypothetical protein